MIPWRIQSALARTFDAAQKVFELLSVPENQAVHRCLGRHGQLKKDRLTLFAFCDRVFFARRRAAGSTIGQNRPGEGHQSWRSVRRWGSLHAADPLKPRHEEALNEFGVGIGKL